MNYAKESTNIFNLYCKTITILYLYDVISNSIDIKCPSCSGRFLRSLFTINIIIHLKIDQFRSHFEFQIESKSILCLRGESLAFVFEGGLIYNLRVNISNVIYPNALYCTLINELQCMIIYSRAYLST